MSAVVMMPAMSPDKRRPDAGRTIGTVGANLRAWRDRKGWSQQELADAAGLARGTIADLERGHSQSPDAHTQRKLEAALKLEQGGLWKERAGATESGSRHLSDENLSGGLGHFLDEHPELGPREIDRLKKVAQSMPPSASADDKVWAYHLAAIRRQLALEDGII